MRGKVGAEPVRLGRCRATTTGVGAIGVEHDGVPCAHGEAVVALAGRAGLRPEVPEVPGRPGGVVILIAGGGPSPRLVPSPRRAIAVRELARRRVGIHVVTGGEHGPRDRIQEARCRLVLRAGTVRDVTGADQDRIRRQDVTEREEHRGQGSDDHDDRQSPHPHNGSRYAAIRRHDGADRAMPARHRGGVGCRRWRNHTRASSARRSRRTTGC